jgi:dTDP-4-amino-4,6-dideoxygalactose transaminase
MPVHLSGQSCDMERIQALSREYGFALIEDASHAVGGRYRDAPVGNCAYSDITVFSFHPVKIITTAEGGMALTNNADLARKMRLAASHGITRDPDLMTHAPDGGWYYQQVTLGYNYRMTEMQAALGISQTERLDEYVVARAAHAERYDTLLATLPLTRPWQSPDTRSAWHLYIVHVDTGQIAASHYEVFEALRADGIGVNLHYIPVHLQPFYRDMGFAPGDFPKAEHYYDGAISLPLYPGMSEDDQDKIVASLTRALEAPSR